MTAPYGASRATWDHWEMVLECGPDLLPVVCQPGLEVSPSSVLKSYGKVPSRFDAAGKVVGFPLWTSYRATDADLSTWMSDDRLGICLQTRRVRALDVDIEDFDVSQDVLELVENWGREHGVVFPIRSRSNSAKWLTLFELKGDYAKQILQTKAGVIEFLATGQQCVVAGTHSSGARYSWGEDYPRCVPRLSEDEFGQLRTSLGRAFGTKDWTEGRVRKTREAGAIEGAIDDPVVKYLQQKGWVRV